MEWKRSVVTTTRVAYSIPATCTAGAFHQVLSMARDEYRQTHPGVTYLPDNWAHVMSYDGDIRIVFDVESTEDAPTGP